MRQVEFRAYITQAELKRLRQRKPSAGWVVGAVALALAWIFSAFGMSPSRLDFGTLKLDSGGRLPVELTNRGLTELRPASITVEGADAHDFALDSEQSCTTVKVGETCVLWVDFRPRGSGEKHAKLIVRSDDGDELSSEFSGKAEGNEAMRPIHPDSVHTDIAPGPVPQVTHDTIPLTDGPRKSTSEGTPHPIARNDPPPKPIRNSPSPAPRPVDPDPRVVAPDPTPQRPAPVPLPYVPTPPVSPTPQGPTPVPTPAPALYAHVTMTPGVAEFQAGSPNAGAFVPSLRPITVTSDGTGDVRQLSLRIGTPGGAFSYRPGCPIYLERGKSCTVQVQFVARDTQSHLDSLNAFDGNARLASVSLRAAGSVVTPPVGRPHVTMTPSELSFGAPTLYAMANVPPRRTVEVRNDGPVDLHALALQMNPSGAPFRFSNCATTLTRGQSCTAEVVFAAKGQASQATIGAYEGGSMLAEVRLSGAGSSATPTKPPGGSVTGTVYLAHPGGTTTPGRTPEGGAQATIPQNGITKYNGPAGSTTPQPGTKPNVTGNKLGGPNHAATTVEQPPRVATRPAVATPPVQRAPVKRAVPRPPPPPIH